MLCRAMQVGALNEIMRHSAAADGIGSAVREQYTCGNMRPALCAAMASSQVMVTRSTFRCPLCLNTHVCRLALVLT